MTLRVALTFDTEHPDRPTRYGVEETLLDILARERVRATFFLQGRWVEARPRTATAIARAGHLIGSHSHYHVRMPLLSDHGCRADVRDAERVIRKACGVDPRPWFRFPFGAGADDTRINEALGDLGYRHIHWDVDAGDWRIGLSRPRLIRGVVDGVARHGDGARVLMHGWPVVTAAALPAIIDGLRHAGASFVTIDELPARAAVPGAGVARPAAGP